MKGERRELTPQMKKRRRKKNIIGFTFILPSLIGFILFMAYPLIYSLALNEILNSTSMLNLVFLSS